MRVVAFPFFRTRNARRSPPERTAAGFSSDESQKRFLNPHSYPVGLEAGLWHRRASMAAALRESGRADGLR
ncbi:MAG: hypothetical protein ACLRX5_04800 [Slackia sp.]